MPILWGQKDSADQTINVILGFGDIGVSVFGKKDYVSKVEYGLGFTKIKEGKIGRTWNPKAKEVLPSVILTIKDPRSIDILIECLNLLKASLQDKKPVKRKKKKNLNKQIYDVENDDNDDDEC